MRRSRCRTSPRRAASRAPIASTCAPSGTSRSKMLARMQLENRARIDHAFSVKITDAQVLRRTCPTTLPQGTDLIGVGGIFHDRLAQEGARVPRHALSADRVLARGDDEVPRVPAGESADRRRRRRDAADRKAHQGRRPEGRTWIPKFRAAAGAGSALRRADLRLGAVGRRSEQDAAGGAAAGCASISIARGTPPATARCSPSCCRAAFAGDPNDGARRAAAQEVRDAMGQRSDLAQPVRSAASRRRAANFPLARTAADPAGGWLPAFAPADGSRPAAGPFHDDRPRHPELAQSDRAVARRCRAARRVLRRRAPALVLRHRDRRWGAAYFPFIRLALARYQPVAFHGAHLSNVVLADFMPLVPDRWLERDPDPRRADAERQRLRPHVYGLERSRRRHATHPRRVCASRTAPSSICTRRRSRRRVSSRSGWSASNPRWARISAGGASPTRSSSTAGRDGPRTRARRQRTLATARVRAADLLAHREFEALIDEGLVDQIFVTPTLWEGNVTLQQLPAAPTRYRLAIAEYEEYLVDDTMPYDRDSDKERPPARLHRIRRSWLIAGCRPRRLWSHGRRPVTDWTVQVP